jgi:hypothetical protein
VGEIQLPRASDLSTRKNRWTGRVEIRPKTLETLLKLLGAEQAMSYLQLVAASKCGANPLSDNKNDLIMEGVSIMPDLPRMERAGLVILIKNSPDEREEEGGTIGGMEKGESSASPKVTAEINPAEELGGSTSLRSVDPPVISQNEQSDTCIEKPAFSLQVQNQDPPKVPYDRIIALYHRHCPTLPKAKAMPEQRKTYIRARWRDDPKYQNLEWWEKFFRYVDGNDFLRGDRTNFKANLDWLMRPTNFVKVIEGNYDRD